jgi:hypothetical protein
VTRDQHHKANDSNDAESHHEQAALFSAIGEETAEDGRNAAGDVGWHAHELRFLVGVAHGFDNGGEEERDRVEWGVNA